MLPSVNKGWSRASSAALIPPADRSVQSAASPLLLPSLISLKLFCFALFLRTARDLSLFSHRWRFEIVKNTEHLFILRSSILSSVSFWACVNGSGL